MQLGGLGERCKLPHRVRAEPGDKRFWCILSYKNLLSAISNIAYFSDRVRVHTLHTLYVYAADWLKCRAWSRSSTLF